MKNANPPDKAGPLRVAISAGEYSGDQHAARVLTALRSRIEEEYPGRPVEFRGMGGRHLREAGMDVVIDAEKSGALNGFNIPLIVYKALGVFLRFVRLLFSWRPHVLVMIDYPDFNLRLSKAARFLNIPTFYFIPPKMWAWRSGRVKIFKKNIDRTATIFPFESNFFRQAGYKRSVFVGHPFNETLLPTVQNEDERRRIIQELGLDPARPLVAVLAGSRKSELKRHVPIALAALDRLHVAHPEVQAVFVFAPNIDSSHASQLIGAREWIAHSTGNAEQIMAIANCGLLKSGTCNLEAAFLDLPFVCFYTAPKISEYLIRTFVSLKEFSLVNIIRSGSITELLQQDATPEKLAGELEALLYDSDYRNKVCSNLREVVSRLASHEEHDAFTPGMSTADRTAALIAECIEPRQSPFAVFRRMMTYLRPYRKYFFGSLACMVVFGASDGVVPFLIKHVLDGIFANQDKGMLTILPVVLIIFTLVRAAADFGQEFLMARVGHSIVRDLRNQVNRHLLSLSSDYFIRNSSGALLSRITSDVLLVRALLTNSLASIIRDTIRIIALLVTAVYLDPFLALIAFVVFPLGLYPVYRFGKRMRRLSRKGQEAIGSLSSLIQETIVGNRVVKIFCRQDYEIQRFEEENERLNETFIKSERVRAVSGPVNEILASFAISGVILYGGLTVISGVRSQGDFIAFLISVFLLYDPFKKLSRVNSAVQQGASGAERIFELLDTESSIVDPSDPVPLPASNAIEFDAVKFRYVAGGDWVLDDIQLQVPEGKKFALVGHSGAGKTTLADLIPRFLDPSEGAVRIGGVDIRTVSLPELRSRITMVSQHTFLFNDTIFNNIAYGKPGATPDMVYEAARAAHAYSFVQDLPQGFETVVGQDGLSLSGGERQRISIARALLKDSPILILDEATASLDNKSEREVQAALDLLQKNRTTIVIAHRLSTIRDADCIIVMDAGRIVEAGSHEELLDQGGAFARLYALQFAHQDTDDSQHPVVN